MEHSLAKDYAAIIPSCDLTMYKNNVDTIWPVCAEHEGLFNVGRARRT